MATFVFELKDIIPSYIENKYKIGIVSNIDNSNEIDIPDNITKISELEKETEIVSFLDQNKNSHCCKVSMIDYSSQKLIKELKYNCYWCRNPFDSEPIGCPIEFVANTAIKKYFSEISKDTYIIKQRITNNEYDINKAKNTENTNLNIKNYYITDGIFCSFNCVLAYIKENKHNKLYENSKMLLNKIIYKLYSKNYSIDPAPHWRILNEYGGFMNINEYRKSFSNSYYTNHGIVRNIPKFRSIGFLYEEKLKF